MKVAFMGAGGIGGLYGGRLARAGGDVILIARGPHLDALRQHGLRVESADLGDFSVPAIRASGDPAEVGPVDLIWLTTKGYDLEQACRQMLPMVGPETVVVPLLNGVDINERVGAIVGMEHVLGGLVMTSALIAEPGVVRHVAVDRLAVGELAGGESARAKAVGEVMAAAGIPCEVMPDIRRQLWIKFLGWNTAAAICALTRRGMGESIADPDVGAIAEACMEETVQIARRKGVGLPEDYSRKWVEAVAKGGSPIRPSLVLDIERGRRTELEVCQGAVVRMGRELAIPTPVNGYIYAALKLHANGRDEPA